MARQARRQTRGWARSTAQRRTAHAGKALAHEYALCASRHPTGGTMVGEAKCCARRRCASKSAISSRDRTRDGSASPHGVACRSSTAEQKWPRCASGMGEQDACGVAVAAVASRGRRRRRRKGGIARGEGEERRGRRGKRRRRRRCRRRGRGRETTAAGPSPNQVAPVVTPPAAARRVPILLVRRAWARRRRASRGGGKEAAGEQAEAEETEGQWPRRAPFCPRLPRRGRAPCATPCALCKSASSRNEEADRWERAGRTISSVS